MARLTISRFSTTRTVKMFAPVGMTILWQVLAAYSAVATTGLKALQKAKEVQLVRAGPRAVT